MIRAAFLALALSAPAASAESVEIADAFVPLPPPGAHAHAAYFTLTNGTDDALVLLAAEAEGYAMAHLHETLEQDGIARMAMLAQVEVPPGGTLSFEPGGMHVMLMGPDQDLSAGETVTVHLVTASGNRVPVVAEVRDGRLLPN